MQVSADGKGCWQGNVFVKRLWDTIKYEEIYLRGHETVSEAQHALARHFYNRRLHSTLALPGYGHFSQQLLAAAAEPAEKSLQKTEMLSNFLGLSLFETPLCKARADDRGHVSFNTIASPLKNGQTSEQFFVCLPLKTFLLQWRCQER